MDTRLDPAQRTAAIESLTSEELDVLVVGGGVVGAGAALDASTRGLRVGLVEMRDWSSGTSSRSSKLIHGGLRYLEMFDFGLVREALRERGLLLDRLAPHLVKKVPFLYPLRRRFVERPYVGAGLLLYDTMGLSPSHPRGVPMHRHLSARGVARVAPGLKPESYAGALQYYDAQVDDARFVLALVRSAVGFGVHAASRMQVTGFLREGERVVGAHVRDLLSGEESTIRARVVLNAAGVWSDEIQDLVGGKGALKVRASKGIHLVVPRDRIRSTTGLILKTEKSVLFVIPWGRHWIIGTTDTAWSLDKSHPAASSADIDYLLEHVNSVLASPLTRDDVEGVYAGLRPLLSGEDADTSKLSREHLVVNPVPGLVMVGGGKYTTYRVMAADAVDAAVHSLGGVIGPCITAQVPLYGADGYRARWNQRHLLARESGLPVARIEHLLNRFGSAADEVLAMIADDPSLAEPLPGAEDYLAAEVVYAVRFEGALHLTDILARRTRISIEAWDRGVSAAPVAARLAGQMLGWDAADEEYQVSLYCRRVEAERASQLQPDDSEANAKRITVREDPVPVEG